MAARDGRPILEEDPMKAAGYNSAWVLVYTSAIMLVLRFVAGPLIHKFSPVGLLAACSALAALGILALSQTAHAGTGVIFAAATLFGVGITFFWPTILGLTSEQCPRGGALTLNAMGGIGMLAVGILGAPFLGYMQESTTTHQLQAANPALYQQVKMEPSPKYLLGRDRREIAGRPAGRHHRRQVQRARQDGDVSGLHFPVLPRLAWLFQIQRRLQTGATGVGWRPKMMFPGAFGVGKVWPASNSGVS